MKKASYILLAGVLLGLSASALAAEGFIGTGKNEGRGLESDGRGGFIGTGLNAGGGWEPDGDGGYKGTGNNRGERWRID